MRRALGVLLALSLLACGGGGQRAPGGNGQEAGARPGEAAGRKLLVFGRGGDSVSLDPAHENDGESFLVCDMIYDTLVRFRPGTTEIEPALAESWEVAADGLTYTFRLRTGVTFHDGSPLTADAVLFSLERQRDPAHPMHGVGGAWKYWSNMGMSKVVAAVEKAGDATVVIRLQAPNAPFLSILTMPFCSIVHPASAEKWGEDFGRHPVGTGAFSFASWEPNQKIVLERNASYWGGAPPLDGIIYRVIPEPNTRLLELQGGQIHGCDNPSPFQVTAVRGQAAIQVVTRPGMNVGYLAMNTQKKPFDDLRVRQAVAHAVDKKALIDRLYEGMGVPAKNPFPDTVWGYADDVEDYVLDPARSKALLAEAGYPQGLDATLWAMPNPRPYMPSPSKVAESLIADLAAAGIRAKMVTYDWATYLAKVEEGEHDMALLGWSADYADPDNFLYPLLSKEATEKPATNIAFWRDDAYSELVAKAKVTLERPAREELYRKAQHLFHEQAPWVPLAHSQQIVLLSSQVSGFVLTPTGRKDFRKADLAGP